MDVSKYGWIHTEPAGLIIGVDLGQANDFTAITIVERHNEMFQKAHDGRSPDVIVRHHHLRHAQRLPLGTPYPDVAEFVLQMVKELSVQTNTKIITPDLIVDGTGVGKPVVDMMRRAGLKPVAVAITGGREQNKINAHNYTVPKRDLVGSLIVTFQESRLKLSSGLPFIQELLHELMNFKARVSASGNEQFDAWRESIHDDLVLATALAVWFGELQLPGCRVVPFNNLFKS